MAAALVTVVIGDVNRGKTTLVARLATALHGRGLRVGVLDADTGQSEIGPPTTVGLGRVTRPLQRLGDAEPVAVRFVGATSVAREQVGTIVAVVRLAARARVSGLETLLVDTSGLVRGDLGQRIKQAKIDALDPDLVIAVDPGGECEPIVAPYRRSPRPRIIRVTPPATARSRSADERRRHREQTLARHFADARRVTLDLTRIALRRPALFLGDSIDCDELAAADLVGHLAGLDDSGQEMVALGAVVELDIARRALTVDTTADVARVVSVTIGQERVPSRA